ncbi:hypothetical protein AYI69_g8004, partial [Smittium culicis]
MKYQNILVYASYLVLTASEEFKNERSSLRSQISSAINIESSTKTNSHYMEYKEATKKLNTRQNHSAHDDHEGHDHNAHDDHEGHNHSVHEGHNHSVHDDHEGHNHSVHDDHEGHNH